MIIIVDFGSQSAHLIARRFRDLGVATQLTEPSLLKKYISQAKGVVLSGGPASVYEAGSPQLDLKIDQLGVPVLGICYGWQMIAHQLSGKVVSAKKEYGPVSIKVTAQNPLFTKVNKQSFSVFMSHSDEVKLLPSGFITIASSKTIPNAAAYHSVKQIYGLQFHPELSHTQFGNQLLRNFAEIICKEQIKPRKIDVNQVLDQVAQQLEGVEGTVVSAISGGVDSAVASALVAKVIGERMKPIYCHNGLMRLGTLERIKTIFQDHLHVKPIVIDCQALFLERLKGITQPEQKRKIIGSLYIELFEKEALKLKDVKYLVQGTIYSDVIESKGSRHAHKIKSHHNVGGLPSAMKLKLIEPLRDFYKDEVRELGKQLGLPKEAIEAQPFPGPGHAIRILGEVTAERLAKQQQADAIVVEVLKETGYYDQVFQSFPVMTGVMTTAVKGDGRAFAELVGLRIYDSEDILSASWSKIPFEVLGKIATRIVNEVPDLSRVVYDITTKPPATMEWE
ncbi:MAG TPA: glutamine-hydrolyzing GMP synthase [Candidatus Woesebacteria bacterium]|nr:glutamine-hydrolyzing GMP synthase [Candidatus Woesebacteria bacterium]